MCSAMRGWRLVMLALALQPCSAHAQQLDAAPVIAMTGSWYIVRTVDPMDDRVVCTGVHKSRYGYQMSEKSLMLTVNGGIRSLQLRFDNAPAFPMRLAHESEKDVRSIILTGQAFWTALSSTRLRAQIFTHVDGVQDVDIDISGMQQAQQVILSGCNRPALYPSIAAARGAAAVAPAPMPSTVCPDVVVQRMKAKSMSDASIAAICATQ